MTVWLNVLRSGGELGWQVFLGAAQEDTCKIRQVLLKPVARLHVSHPALVWHDQLQHVTVQLHMHHVDTRNLEGVAAEQPPQIVGLPVASHGYVSIRPLQSEFNLSNPCWSSSHVKHWMNMFSQWQCHDGRTSAAKLWHHAPPNHGRFIKMWCVSPPVGCIIENLPTDNSWSPASAHRCCGSGRET